MKKKFLAFWCSIFFTLGTPFFLSSIFSEPSVQWKKNPEVLEWAWSSFSLDVFFDDNTRVIGFEAVSSGSTRLGPITLTARERERGRNHLSYAFSLTTRDEVLSFQRLEVLYRIGTGTETLRKRVPMPEVRVVRWVFPLAVAGLIAAVILGGGLIFKRIGANPSKCSVGPPPPQVSDEEKSFLARQLTEENYTGFFVKLAELERRTGREFPLAAEKRERIQYGGDRELCRDLPRLMGRFLKQFESPGDES